MQLNIQFMKELIRHIAEALVDHPEQVDVKCIEGDNSIIIELKRGSQPKKVLNQLYKFTQMEVSLGVIMLAISENRPQVFNLKERGIQTHASSSSSRSSL